MGWSAYRTGDSQYRYKRRKDLSYRFENEFIKCHCQTSLRQRPLGSNFDQFSGSKQTVKGTKPYQNDSSIQNQHVIGLSPPRRFVISRQGRPIIFEEKRNTENCSNLYGVREFAMRKMGLCCRLVTSIRRLLSLKTGPSKS